MRRLIILIIVSISFKEVFSQRIKQLGQHNLAYYTPYMKHDTLYLNGITPPTSTYQILVHGTDSLIHKIPSSTFATGNTLYTGDGTLAGDRIVTGGANGLTFTSTRTGTNSTITINNTSTGRGINVSSGAGIGVRSVGTTGIGVQGVSTDNYGVWSESTNAPGLYVLSTASNAADMTINPTSTNTVATILELIRSSQSAGTDGIGQSIDFNINNTAAAGTTVLANQIISKLTTATSTVETSQLQLKGRNAGTATTVATFDGDGTYTTIGRRIIAVTVSAAGTLTLGNSHSYVFSGTTTTWTLPAVSGTTGVIYYIKNRGSGDITLNAAAAANEIYSTSAVNTYTISAGAAIILISDGTYFTVN